MAFDYISYLQTMFGYEHYQRFIKKYKTQLYFKQQYQAQVVVEYYTKKIKRLQQLVEGIEDLNNQVDKLNKSKKEAEGQEDYGMRLTEINFELGYYEDEIVSVRKQIGELKKLLKSKLDAQYFSKYFD